MRVLFAGTPDIAVPSLKTLAASHTVVAVLTNPDKTKGRGRKVMVSHVKEAALELDLPLLQPYKLDADLRDAVAALKPDLLVCIAYGKIFRQVFLDLFPLGGINLHPSRLPDLRGPSPLNSIILRGDKESAVTVQKLALQMDSGDILLQETLPITDRETTATLTEKVAELGAGYLQEVLGKMEEGTISARQQDHDAATFCSLIGKNDGLIDWQDSAVHLDRIIRAYTPWPHGFSGWNGQRLNILEAHPVADRTSDAPPGTVTGMDKKDGILIQTGEGLLAVTRLQLQSKKPLDFKSFLNGTKDFIASVLGEIDES
ncbi:MAG: methionyl-tRNA formyltransferase [Spirochaetaceae bacterium 4572_59]|nr:MAG: methionyl-tRNA formyltransferase [Spirochaetaceae bacterium 4572_59]